MRISRIDSPEEAVWELSLRSPQEAFVLRVQGKPARAFKADGRQKGRNANAFVTGLRRHIKGAKVDSILEHKHAGIVLRLSHKGKSSVLLFGGENPSLWRDEKCIYGKAKKLPTLKSLIKWTPVTTPAPNSAAQIKEAWRKDGAQELNKAIRKAKRLIRAVAGDLERATEAETLRREAERWNRHRSIWPKRGNMLDIKEDGVVIQLLAPTSNIQEHIDRLFHRARRLDKARDGIKGRLKKVRAELQELESIRLEALSEEEFREALPKKILRPRTSKQEQQSRLPYREHKSIDGISILVGRSAADNDQLTVKIARPYDLWLHARGVRGSHVVVRLQKNQSCPLETLIDAATLAAYFSSLRGESTVDVIYTPRRFVRKGRNQPKGRVQVDREKVIAVDLTQERLTRLLNRQPL